MKILYISPENTVGTLSLWREEHISRGNQCRAVTFFRSPRKFEDDVCLDLPFNFTKPLMSKFRNIIYKSYRGSHGYFKKKMGILHYGGLKVFLIVVFLSLKIGYGNQRLKKL